MKKSELKALILECKQELEEESVDQASNFATEVLEDIQLKAASASGGNVEEIDQEFLGDVHNAIHAFYSALEANASVKDSGNWDDHFNEYGEYQ